MYAIWNWGNVYHPILWLINFIEKLFYVTTYFSPTSPHTSSDYVLFLVNNLEDQVYPAKILYEEEKVTREDLNKEQTISSSNGIMGL